MCLALNARPNSKLLIRTSVTVIVFQISFISPWQWFGYEAKSLINHFKNQIKQRSRLSFVSTIAQQYEQNRNIHCSFLLSGFNCLGIWLNSLLLDISPPSVCGIFRRGLSDIQMNSLSGLPREASPEDAAHRFWRNVEQREFSHRPRSSIPDKRYTFTQRKMWKSK